MGTTLREIVYDIGGGIPNNREFKAAQTGGPSGGCIPKEHLDTPIDYESLSQIGSMMGSGGLIVMDDTKCMVNIAKFYLEFTVDESCGKCTPCRIGTKRMLEILERITEGNGETEDLENSISQLDILYMTRVQKERFLNEEDYIRLKDIYILNKEKLHNAKKDLCVLHPLPRVNEISTDIDDDPRACYFKQVEYGKYMRMAIILKLLSEQ